MKLGEEIGLTRYNDPTFWIVQLFEVTAFTVWVIDRDTGELMEFSRVCGGRRRAPEDWNFWFIDEDQLDQINGGPTLKWAYSIDPYPYASKPGSKKTKKSSKSVKSILRKSKKKR